MRSVSLLPLAAAAFVANSGEAKAQAVNLGGGPPRMSAQPRMAAPHARGFDRTIPAGVQRQSPGNNIVADGQTATRIWVNGRYTTITTSTMSGGNAFNSFKTFSEAEGNTVNLIVPNSAGKLVNIVREGSVNILGTLNSYQNGKIGGNVVFVDSYGMVVGKSGSVNVGSLTVVTPTQATVNAMISGGKVNDALVARVVTGNVPLSADGSVVIDGRVNATQFIKITATDVRIAGSLEAAQRAAVQKARFAATVNTRGMQAGGMLVSRNGNVSIGGGAPSGGAVRTAPVRQAGTISIKGEKSVAITGTLKASGAAGRDGGKIDVTSGGNIAVGGTAKLDVSGAGKASNAGTIYVKADENLTVADGAAFKARGGTTGDGGFVELSAGKTETLGNISVDLGAMAGKSGTLLLDPFDLVIGDVNNNYASFTKNIINTDGSIQLQADNSITMAADAVLQTGHSDDITLVAPHITLLGGARITAGGSVYLTALATTGNASVTIGDTSGARATITGTNLDISATSSGTDTASATVLITNADVTLTGNLDVLASATVNKSVNFVGAVASTNVLAAVDVLSGATLTVGGHATLQAAASTTITASGAPNAVSTKVTDAAASIVDATSVARVHIGDNAVVHVDHGALKLAADNSVSTTSTADASSSQRAGTTVAVSVLNVDTSAVIDGAAQVSAASLALEATSHVAATTTAKASSEGAGEADSSSKGGQYLADPKYTAYEKTGDSGSNGGIKAAGALAIADVTSTTLAKMASSNVATVAGSTTLKSVTENSSIVVADGSSATGSNGVGVAVGIGLSHISNQSLLEQKINTAALNLSATMAGTAADNAFSVTATSGAGASNVGVAGALATNLLDSESTARFGSSAANLGLGAVSITASDLSSASAVAGPAGAGALGAKVGVGASVALNLVATRSTAELADGANLVNAGDVTLQATGIHSVVTEAEQGSAGGVSVTPVVATSIVSDRTTASIGALTGGLNASGNITVEATQLSTALTQASGAAAGDKAGIGAALAIAVLDEQVIATTSSSITTGGAVSFSAKGASLAATTAIASASGGNGTDDSGQSTDKDGTVDDKVQKQTTGSSQLMAGANIGDAKQKDDAASGSASASGKASTSEGGVAVAAAIAVDVSTVKVQAYVPSSVNVAAGGALSVATVSNVDAKTSADGSTAPALTSGSGSSKAGVGAAVAINVVNVDNRAELGTGSGQTGTYSAAALNVSALKTDLHVASPVAWNSADLPHAPAATTLGRVDQIIAYAKSGASGAKVSVAGSLAVNILTSNSLADIDSANVTIAPAGAVVIAADQEAYLSASALPSVGGASGEKVGVGASVALNTALTSSEASVKANAGLSGANSLSVKADSHLDSDAQAEAGAKGGTALDAVVAFTILSEKTRAAIESGSLIDVGDFVEVHATSNGAHSALASGSATSSGSGGTAIGGAVALVTGTGLFNLVSGQGGPVTSETTASIARNIKAGGDLDVAASGTHTYDAAATATASGGSELDKGAEGGSKSTSSQTLGSAPANDSMKQEQKGLSDNQGGSSGGKLSVAAAVGATIVGDSVKASLGDGLTIHAGSVSVKADSNDLAQSLGNAAAVSTQQDNGIGMGAALTIVGNTTKASIGNTAHIVTDGDITIGATSTMNNGLGGFTAEAMSGASGKKLAVAGALAIGISNSNTSAVVGNDVAVDLASDTPSTRAGAVSVTALNTSSLASKAWSGSYSGGGVGVGASIAAAISNDSYTASIGDRAQINADSVTVSATNAAVNDLFSTLNGLAEPIQAALTDVNSSLQAQLGNANTLVTGVTGAAGATDAASKFKTDFVNQITADKNKLLDSLRSAGTLARDLPLLGSNNFYTEVVAGAASTDKLAIAGGLALQVILSKASATIGTNASIDATGAVSVSAADNAISRTLVGALAASGNKDAGGVSLGIIVNAGKVDARIGERSTISNSSGINVSAGADHQVNLFEAAAGVASANGLAGILGVVVSTVDVNASTGIGSTLNSTGSLNVAALNKINTLNIAGGVALAGKTALGGVAINTTIANTATATLDSSAASATMVDAGSVSVSAKSAEQLINVGVAGAAAGDNAISGVITPLIQVVTTKAGIGNNAQVTTQTGDVKVAADDNTLLVNVAGVIAAGGNNGVGGAIAYGQITDTVTATIGDNVTINAAGSVNVTALEKAIISDAVVSGAAGSNVAVTGSLASSVVIDTVSATIGKGAKIGTSNRPSGVLVSADDTTLVVDLAGAISASGSTGVGAGVDANVLTKNTTATIADNAEVYTSGDVVVQANSGEKVFSLVVGFAAGSSAGVAGSVGTYVLAGQTLANIAGGTDIQADGNVVVIANDANDLTRLVGSGAIGGNAGVGGAIGVSVAVQNTKATISDSASVQALGLHGTTGVTTGIDGEFITYVGEALSVLPVNLPPDSKLANAVSKDINAVTVLEGLQEGGSLLVLSRKTTPHVDQVRGVAVAASATSSLRSMAVSGSGAGSAAVSISGDLPVVVSTTEASIGDHARINTATTDAPGANQSVTVAASSDLYHLGVAGSITVGGTAGVGAGSETAILNNTTTASIGLGADVKAARNVAVTAKASENFAGSAVSAAAGGTAGVAGGLTGFVLTSNTKAVIYSNADDPANVTNVFAGGNVIVTADDQTRAVLTGGTIGIGVGAAGVGMGLGIAVVVKTTEATIGDSAKVTGLGNGSNNDFDEYTGADFSATQKGRGVLVAANSGQSLAGIVGAGSGGLYAGVAGAVAVEVFVDQTRATIGQDAIINGTNTGANANQDVIVAARNSTVVSMAEGTVAVGAAGIGGAVDVAVIADATSALIGDGASVTAKRDVGVLALTNRQTASTVASVAGGVGGVGAAISVLAIANGPNAEQTAKMDSSGRSLNSEANTLLSSNVIDAQFLSTSTNSNVKSASAKANEYKKDLSVQKSLPTQIAPGNSATIGNATVNAGSNVNVRARDSVNALIADGAVMIGAGMGAGIGIAVIDVANTATITNNSQVTAGGVDVSALSDRTLNGTGLAGAALGVSAALVSLTDATATKASINQSTVDALGSVQVRASNNEQIRVATTTFAVGGAGGLSLVVVKPVTDARIDGASTVNAATGIDGIVAVGAVNITNIISGAAGVVGGGGGVGATIISELPSTTALVGAGSNVTSGVIGGTPTAGDVLVSASTQETMLSIGAGVALGDGLGGALTIIARDETTTADIAKATVFATGNVGVMAGGTAADDVVVGGVAAGGGGAVGGSVGVTVLNSTVRASIADEADVTALGLGSDLTYVKDYQTSFNPYGGSETIRPSSLQGVSGGTDLQTPVSTDDVSKVGSILLLQQGTINALNATARGVVVNAAKAQSIRSLALGGGVGGFIGVGLSGNVPVILGTTSASIGASAKINQQAGTAGALQSVVVAATNQTYALNIVGAAGGGIGGGIGASLSTAIVSNQTRASIGDGAVVSAKNNVAVTALAGEDIATIAAAGAASGYVGVAGGLSLISIDNTTSALIGKNAVVEADNNVIVAANDVTREATFAGSIVLSGGGAVGAAVSVGLISKQTTATIDTGAQVSGLALGADTFTELTGTDVSASRTAKGVLVDAQSVESSYVFAIGGGAGLFVSAAGAIGVNVFNTNTFATINSGAIINGVAGGSNQQDVAVTARDLAGIASASYGASLGLASLAGGADIGVLNSNVGASIGDATINAGNDVLVNAIANKAINSTAVSAAAGGISLAAGVSVYSIGNGVDPNSRAITDLQTKDQSGSVTNYAGSTLSVGGSLGTLTTGTTASANKTAGSSVATSSASNASATLNARLGSIDVSSKMTAQNALVAGTSATMGNAHVTAHGAVTVNGNDQVAYAAKTGTLSVGGIGVGAGIGIFTDNATNTATVTGTGTGTIDAGSMSVAATTGHAVNLTSYAGAFALGFSAQADVAVVTDNTITRAAITNYAIAETAGLTLSAASNRNLNATGSGVAAAGVAAVGLSLANATIGGSVNTTLQNVRIGTSAVHAGPVTVLATSNDSATATAFAAAGGLVGAGNGAEATATVNLPVTLTLDSDTIYSDATSQNDAVTLLAKATDSANATASGITVAGGVAVGGSVANASLSPQVTLNIIGGSIQASSLRADAQALSGGANAYAESAAGAFVGVNATSATATDNSQAIATGTGGIIQTTGALNFNARTTEANSARANGNVAGFVAAGFSVAAANTQRVTKAAFVNMSTIAGGSIGMAAESVDSTSVNVASGTGGLFAGAAANGSTNSNNQTTALISGNASTPTNVNAGSGLLSIVARHTETFSGSVDASRASAVGGSGSRLTQTVISPVSAGFGDYVNAVAGNLTIEATNAVTRPLAPSGWDVQSRSGGFLDLPAAVGTTSINVNAYSSLGANTKVHLIEPASGFGIATINAANDVVVQQGTKVDSSGVILIVNGQSNVAVTARSTVAFGQGSSLIVDMGSIAAGAWSNVNVDARAVVSANGGFAGSPDGLVTATVTSEDLVSLAKNVRVEASSGVISADGTTQTEGSIWLSAGYDRKKGAAQILGVNAALNLYNNTAIPIDNTPNVQANLTSNAIVSVAQSDPVQGLTDTMHYGVNAAGDISLMADQGLMSVTADGTGTNVYKEALAKAASALNQLVGGGDVSFQTKSGTANKSGSSVLIIDGVVDTGIARNKFLTITYDKTGNCDPSSPSCVITDGNIKYYSDTFRAGGAILDRLGQIDNLLIVYDKDTIAKAAYASERIFLQDKLVALGLATYDANGANFTLKSDAVVGAPASSALKLNALTDALNVFRGDVSTSIGSVLADGLTGIALAWDASNLAGNGTDAAYVNYAVTTNVQSAKDALVGLSNYGAINGAFGPAGDAFRATLADIGSKLTAGNDGLTAARGYVTDIKGLAAGIDTRVTQIVGFQQDVAQGNKSFASVQNDLTASFQGITTNQGDIVDKNGHFLTSVGIIKDSAIQLSADLSAIQLAATPASPTTNDNSINAGLSKTDANVANTGALTRINSASQYMNVIINGGTLPSGTSTPTVVTGLAAAVSDYAAKVAAPASGKSISAWQADLNAKSQAVLNGVQGGVGKDSVFLQLDNTGVQLGNINLTAQQVMTTVKAGDSFGSGQILAPGDASITITNETAATLKIQNLNIPLSGGGRLTVNGVQISKASDISAVTGKTSGFAAANVVASGGFGGGAQININSNYNPLSVAYYDPTSQSKYLNTLQLSPDVILLPTGTINNLTGAVNITSQAGNIYVQGKINAGSISIVARNGDLVTSYVNGFNHVGGDPANGYATVGTAVTPADPIATGLGLVANGDVFLAARYLNINSTVQSGIADWSLKLTPNTQLVTTDATRIRGLDANNVTTLISNYKALTSKAGVPTTADLGMGVTLNLLTGEMTFSIATVQASNAVAAASQGTVQPTFTGSYKFLASDSKVDGVYQAVVGASYDTNAGQIVVDGTAVKGGYIKVFGQIINTNQSSGNLNVLDGFGTIKIENTTNLPVVLSTLDTGADAKGTGRGTEGVIDITDVRVNPVNNRQIDATHTVFTRDYDAATSTGTVVVKQEQGILNEKTGLFEANATATPQTTASSTGDRTAVYNPMITQRYVYMTAADYAETKNVSKTDGTTVVQNSTTSSSINMASGAYVFIDYDNITTNAAGTAYIIKPTAAAAAAAAAAADVTTPLLTTSGQTKVSTQTGASQLCLLLSSCAPTSSTVYYQESTEFRQISSRSMKADYPINVNFIGANTGTINVTSNTDIILKGNLNNVAGTTTVTATGNASILQGTASAVITAQSIKLDAANSIGKIADGSTAWQPVKVVLTDLDGVARGKLDASASNGVVAISSTADLIVGRITAAGSVTDRRGNIVLSAGTNISAASSSSLIQADKVSLTAVTGSIGSVAGNAELNVNTGFTTDQALRPFGDPATVDAAYYGLSASASGDINIHAHGWGTNASGTILANSIVSTGGNVKLTTLGQVLDGNPAQQIDTKAYAQLVAYWESLGLTEGANNQARQDAAVLSYEQGETQSYRQYWQIRNSQPNKGAAFDPNFQVTYAADSAQYQSLAAYYRTLETSKTPGAASADIDARVAADIAKQAADDTARYRALNSQVGTLTSSYDANYIYTASAAEKSSITQGATWTEKALGFPLNAGALKQVTNTNVVIKAPNVSGRNVTILAAGGIGENVVDNGVTGIRITPKTNPVSELTDAEKVALATAERSDLELTINGVILPTDATPEQLAAYQAAVAAGIANTATTIHLGLAESQMAPAELAALNATAAGIANKGTGTYITVLSKRPLNVAGTESLNVTTSAPAYLASRDGLQLGNISVAGEARIKAIGSLINAATSSIRTGNIILESATGSVGGATPLVLNLNQGATITARALNSVNLSAKAGTVNGLIDANIDTIYSPNQVTVRAEGSILNANNDRLVNILGKNIDLTAEGGSIGSLINALNVGTSPGGAINANARNSLISLYGVAGLDFTIGSAIAGTSNTLDAAGAGMIDGLVTAGGDIAMSAGGRWTMTASANVLSAAGQIQLSADTLKMLRGARMEATSGSVRVDTTNDALVTGISAGGTDIKAIEITAGGHILAGSEFKRAYDLITTTAGAGIKLTATLGIGDQIWADSFVKDQPGSPAGSADLKTDMVNPLRIFTSKADLTTIQRSSAYVDASIGQWLKLTSPDAMVWADMRSPRPVLGYDVQLFQPSKQFNLYQNGARTGTNAVVVQYSERAEIAGTRNGPIPTGGSLVRDIDRISTFTGVGSVLLRDDSPDYGGAFFHGDAFAHFLDSLRDRKVRRPLKGHAVNVKGLAFEVSIGD